MANLTFQNAKITGGAVALQAAASGGDTVAPNSRGAVLVNNGSGASITVTVAVPGNTRYAQPEPDVAVAVAAGAYKLIGPFPSDLADPSDGLVHLTYSSATSVEVAAVSI